MECWGEMVSSPYNAVTRALESSIRQKAAVMSVMSVIAWAEVMSSVCKGRDAPEEHLTPESLPGVDLPP